MYKVEEPEMFYAKGENFPLKTETYKIIGLAMEVYKICAICEPSQRRVHERHKK